MPFEKIKGRGLLSQKHVAYLRHPRMVRGETEETMDKVEREILERLTNDLFAAGYTLKVYNGVYNSPLCENTDLLLEYCNSTGVDQLIAFRDGKRAGWVEVVFGNGRDIISDWSESITVPVEKVVDWVNGHD